MGCISLKGQPFIVPKVFFSHHISVPIFGLARVMSDDSGVTYHSVLLNVKLGMITPLYFPINSSN